MEKSSREKGNSEGFLSRKLSKKANWKLFACIFTVTCIHPNSVPPGLRHLLVWTRTETPTLVVTCWQWRKS